MDDIKGGFDQWEKKSKEVLEGMLGKSRSGITDFVDDVAKFSQEYGYGITSGVKNFLDEFKDHTNGRDFFDDVGKGINDWNKASEEALHDMFASIGIKHKDEKKK